MAFIKLQLKRLTPLQEHAIFNSFYYWADKFGYAADYGIQSGYRNVDGRKVYDYVTLEVADSVPFIEVSTLLDNLKIKYTY